MSSGDTDERRELLELVTRLLTGQFSSEDEVDRMVATFAARVPHPNPIGLIYYWEEEFDAEPTAEEIVDRAFAYRPTEL